jgi:hypothetical protein
MTSRKIPPSGPGSAKKSFGQLTLPEGAARTAKHRSTKVRKRAENVKSRRPMSPASNAHEGCNPVTLERGEAAWWLPKIFRASIHAE